MKSQSSINRYLILVILWLYINNGSTQSTQIQSQNLTGGNNTWYFKTEKNQTFMKANVPSSVHLDLKDNDVIGDYYFGDNAQHVQWIEDHSWVYELNMTVDNEKLLNEDVQELVFEGLDTFTQVYLNEQMIGYTNNFHRQWKFDIKGKLKKAPEVNTITVQFTSATKIIQEEQKRLLPMRMPELWAYTRKPAYHFGWDWAPRLVTCGIFKPVYLRAYSHARITSVSVRYQQVHRGIQQVNVYGGVEVHVNKDNEYKIEVVNKTTNKSIDIIYSPLKVTQKEGFEDNIAFNFTVDKPYLWWPKTMGTPYLYQLRFDLYTSHNDYKEVIDSKDVTIGIRNITLIQETDNNGLGQSFKFQINGQQFYAKGANYVPLHFFIAEGIRNPRSYETLLQAASDANFNMIRLWGGGQYELDTFYETCDRLGILIWHDFPFANTLYPGNQEFLENVIIETKENLKRIRNHPSIAFWNGNNEILQGWKEWGWSFYNTDQNLAWNWYEKLFIHTLPDILELEDPDKSYIQSSPLSSQVFGHEKGNIHYWMVWWGAANLETYETHLGRFNSEYGVQSYLTYNALHLFLNESDFKLDSKSFLYHEKHRSGIQLIDKYVTETFNVSKMGKDIGLDNYLYLSQCMQAYGVGIRIESTRRSIPYSMGSLYWQLNDLWPVFSWSSIDYFGQQKALHYKAKRLYSNIVISIKDMTNKNFDHNIKGANLIQTPVKASYDKLRDFHVSIVNDNLFEVQGTFDIEIIAFTGKVLAAQQLDIQLPENNNSLFSVIFDNTISINPNKTYVRAKFTDNNDEDNYYTSYFHYTKPKQFELPKPDLQLKYDFDENQIIFTTTNFASYVYIYLEKDATLRLSDNFFDISVGWPITVKILSYHKLSDIKDPLKIKTIYDATKIY